MVVFFAAALRAGARFLVARRLVVFFAAALRAGARFLVARFLVAFLAAALRAGARRFAALRAGAFLVTFLAAALRAGALLFFAAIATGAPPRFYFLQTDHGAGVHPTWCDGRLHTHLQLGVATRPNRQHRCCRSQRSGTQPPN